MDAYGTIRNTFAFLLTPTKFEQTICEIDLNVINDHRYIDC